jgi:hypothetical protein
LPKIFAIADLTVFCSQACGCGICGVRRGVLISPVKSPAVRMACSNCSCEAFSCSTVAEPMVTPTNLTVGTAASARCTCTAQFKHDMPSIVI